LVSQSFSATDIKTIVQTLVATYAPSFTTTNVESAFVVGKIVFNQISLSQAIKKLANIVRYDWFIDPDKDVHFFPKNTELAPFNLTDISGNYVNVSLARRVDGSQLANTVKVRGAEYDAAVFTDKITVNGGNSKSFNLPYKFSNFSFKLNGVSKTIGIDYITDPSTVDALYNYQERLLKFPANLADGDIIEFTGNPKVRVLAIASDAASIATYGTKEKIIEDTSIESLDTARKRAIAEVQAYKDPTTEADFDTYASGLRVGQLINITSTNRGANNNYLIDRVTFKARTGTQFYYSVHVITTRRYELIELLQSLLQPDQPQVSEAEVAEDIRTDIQELNIVELIQTIAPYTDVATIAITENIQKDPLGAGVEPDWVWAPYFPSSPTDTKREGVWEYSLKFY
jgi:hypothetical protein